MKKLLIVTQAVDENDSALGFFTRWIAGLAPGFANVEVICLREGKHALPANVRVHPLTSSKESNTTIYRSMFVRTARAVRFLGFAWRLRREYDAVFVHMNQEYVLIAGWLWRLLGKRIFLWRNHGSGSFLTHLAAYLSRKVFYTSSASYTARFPNALRMPVGVDLARFAVVSDVSRIPGSVLMVGRIAPKKHVRAVVEALVTLSKEGRYASLTLAGGASAKDQGYQDDIVSLASAAGIGLSLRGAVAHSELPRIFAAHDVVINVSEPGMFDKTMLEALASGCLLLTRHEDLTRELDGRLRTSGEPADIAQKLAHLTTIDAAERECLVAEGERIAEAHSLTSLVARLTKELYA